MTTPRLANDTEHGRYYHLGEEQFVSVTTVLGAINKPALVPAARKIASQVALERFPEYAPMIWAGQMEKARMQASRDAKKVWDDKSDLGTRVHKAVENVLAGWDPDDDDEVKPYVNQFDLWVARSGFQVLHSEVTVFSRRYGYAGTVDLLGDLAFSTTLLDVKTGGVWPEHALQLTAYANADFMLIDDSEIPLPKVEMIGVLDLKADSCDVVEMSSDGCLETFLSAKQVWEWQNRG